MTPSWFCLSAADRTLWLLSLWKIIPSLTTYYTFFGAATPYSCLLTSVRVIVNAIPLPCAITRRLTILLIPEEEMICSGIKVI